MSERKKHRPSLRTATLQRHVKSLQTQSQQQLSTTPRRAPPSRSAAYSTPRGTSTALSSASKAESARKPTTVLDGPVPEPDSDAEDLLLIHGPSVRTSSTKKRRSSRYSGTPGSTVKRARVRLNYTPRSGGAGGSTVKPAARTLTYDEPHALIPDNIDDDDQQQQQDTFAFTKAGQALRHLGPNTSSSPPPAAAHQDDDDVFFDTSHVDQGGGGGGADFDSFFNDPGTDNLEETQILDGSLPWDAAGQQTVGIGQTLDLHAAIQLPEAPPDSDSDPPQPQPEDQLQDQDDEDEISEEEEASDIEQHLTRASVERASVDHAQDISFASLQKPVLDKTLQVDEPPPQQVSEDVSFASDDLGSVVKQEEDWGDGGNATLLLEEEHPPPSDQPHELDQQQPHSSLFDDTQPQEGEARPASTLFNESMFDTVPDESGDYTRAQTSTFRSLFDSQPVQSALQAQLDKLASSPEQSRRASADASGPAEKPQVHVEPSKGAVSVEQQEEKEQERGEEQDTYVPVTSSSEEGYNEENVEPEVLDGKPVEEHVQSANGATAEDEKEASFFVAPEAHAQPPDRVIDEGGASTSSPLRSTDGSPTLKPSAFQVHVESPQQQHGQSPPTRESAPAADDSRESEAPTATAAQLRETLRNLRKSTSPGPIARASLSPSAPPRHATASPHGLSRRAEPSPSVWLRPQPSPSSSMLSSRDSQHRLGSPLEAHASSGRDLFTPSPPQKQKPSPQSAQRQKGIEPVKRSPPEQPVEAQELVAEVPEPPPLAMPSAHEAPDPPLVPNGESEADVDADYAGLDYRVEELSSPRKRASAQQQSSSQVSEKTQPPAAHLGHRRRISSPKNLIPQLRAAQSSASRHDSPESVVSSSPEPPEDGDQQQHRQQTREKEVFLPPPSPTTYKSPHSPRRNTPAKRANEPRSLFPQMTSSPVADMPELTSLRGFLASPVRLPPAQRSDREQEEDQQDTLRLPIAPVASSSRISVEDQINVSGRSAYCLLCNVHTSSVCQAAVPLQASPNGAQGDRAQQHSSPLSSPVRTLQQRRSTPATQSSGRSKGPSPAQSPFVAPSPRKPTTTSPRKSKSPNKKRSSSASFASIAADNEDGSDDDMVSVGSNVSPVRMGDLPRSTKRLMNEITSSPSAHLMSSPGEHPFYRSPSVSWKQALQGSPLKQSTNDAPQAEDDEQPIAFQVEPPSQDSQEAERSNALARTLNSPRTHDEEAADQAFDAVPEGTVAERTTRYEDRSGELGTEDGPDDTFVGKGRASHMPFSFGNSAVASSVSRSSRPGSARKSSHRRTLSGSTIEIRCLDANAAARAAAILKLQHDYQINKEDSPAAREAKERKKNTRIAELLQRAEAEVTTQVDEQSRRSTSPVMQSPVARTGAASLEVPTHRHIMRHNAWSKSDWRHLENLLKQIQRELFDRGQEPNPDPEYVVRRFLEQLALSEQSLEGHWSK